jgi:hypothetical protein
LTWSDREVMLYFLSLMVITSGSWADEVIGGKRLNEVCRVYPEAPGFKMVCHSGSAIRFGWRSVAWTFR